MQDTQTHALHTHRRFAQSADAVYSAWLNPALACRFLFATPGGEMRVVDLDPRPGGHLLMVELRNGEKVVHVGEYLELARPQRLSFTFGIGRDSAERDRVDVDISALDEGCELQLTHHLDARWSEQADNARAGWEAMLAHLAAALESVKPHTT